MQVQDSVKEQLFWVNTFFLGQYIAMKKQVFLKLDVKVPNFGAILLAETTVKAKIP